jgi:SAM-dependent methyltransferase
MRKAIEAGKMHQDRIDSGFYEKYMQGTGLDIGYKGLELHSDVEPILPNAKGIDLDTPGYDGIHLPFTDESIDFVFASHVLEHIEDYHAALKEWYRVLKIGGFLILMLPHCGLYERSYSVAGAWGSCNDHKRVYTPATLLEEIETALLNINSYRLVHIRDNDKNYNYDRPTHVDPDFYRECFEIECVLQRIKTPKWNVM